jgi:cation diffusion facilitator CzcD-associated flavoprotein CzcO
MTDLIDVAIIGAGPYGLSLAAHLRNSPVAFRIFGLPMRPWRTAMPDGMLLKSEGFASNLSDPTRSHTLKAFCVSNGHAYAPSGTPIPVETFSAYGLAFQRALVPQLENVLVTSVTCNGDGFELTLADAGRLLARRVVIATGVEHFAHLPEQLSGLPADLCSHSCRHPHLTAFGGREVIVVGAGQSALESAALLHENGADVHLVVRGGSPQWNGRPLDPERSLAQRLRQPPAGLGSGWEPWLYSEQPQLFRLLPPGKRVSIARAAFGPAGAWWLRPRVDGKFHVHLDHSIVAAHPAGDRVRLRLRTARGDTRDILADHVIAATGYRPDIARLPFLDEQLRNRIRTLGGMPLVGRDFQSSIRGLHFIGPSAATSFGPVMRFVYGAGFAARRVARAFASGGAGQGSGSDPPADMPVRHLAA